MMLMVMSFHWQVVAAERLFDERTRITFRLPDGHGSTAWPHRTELVYVVTVGRELELDLVTRNAGGLVFYDRQDAHRPAPLPVGTHRPI